MRTQVVIPRTLRIFWVVTWAITYTATGWGGVSIIVQALPTGRRGIGEVLLGCAFLAMAITGMLSISGHPKFAGMETWTVSDSKTLRDVASMWHGCANSKHPNLCKAGSLVFGNLINLLFAGTMVVWFLTNSVVLTVLAIGAGAAAKLFISLLAWVWASLSSNLPSIGVVALLQRLCHWWRRRHTAERKDRAPDSK